MQSTATRLSRCACVNSNSKLSSAALGEALRHVRGLRPCSVAPGTSPFLRTYTNRFNMAAYSASNLPKGLTLILARIVSSSLTFQASEGWYRYGDSNPGPVAENHVS